MTIWDLLMVLSIIGNTIWAVACWSHFLSRCFAPGTQGRAIWGTPLQEVRPIMREATAAYIVANIIWQAHDGSLNGWDWLGYGCNVFVTWIIWINSDDDDRWAKRFRKVAHKITPLHLQPHPEGGR